MVTTRRAAPPSEEIIFTTKLTSLGRQRDRWCIVLPPSVLRLIDHAQAFTVVLRPTGSLVAR